MAQKFQYVVVAGPLPGRDQDYNDWYDNTHIHDLLAVPGVVGAQRFQLEKVEGAEPVYMTVYDIETDDLDAFIADTNGRANTDRMRLTDSLDRTTLKIYYTKPIRDRLTPA